MKSLFAKVSAAFAALLVTSMAMAVVYYGFNPSTGLNTSQGTPISAGNLPVISTNSCTATNLVGGAGAYQFTAGATSCTMTFTFPSAAPNGYFCVASDETTPADTMRQSAHTSTTCTITGTVVAADNIVVEVNGF